jgi:hypothetical protein
MHNLIDRNIDKIIKVIDRDKDIKPYLWLAHQFNDVDVSSDMGF